MSNTDSDSEQSHNSDDSQFNYIPGYAIEVKDEANVNEERAALDLDTFEPYEDEPIATEEWVAEYKEKQETQADFERKLQDRYDQKNPVDSWWVFAVCCLVALCVYLDSLPSAMC